MTLIFPCLDGMISGTMPGNVNDAREHIAAGRSALRADDPADAIRRDRLYARAVRRDARATASCHCRAFHIRGRWREGLPKRGAKGNESCNIGGSHDRFGVAKQTRDGMRSVFSSWQAWAVLSAAFAALTAIFAKVGVENVGSDFATFIRTIVILCAAGAILAASGQWQPLASVTGRSYVFLVLSGMATGGSWICYFRALKLGDAARVAPIDKLSVVLVAVFSVAFLGEKLALQNWLGVALIALGAILVAYRV
jgi:transporter family protein